VARELYPPFAFATISPTDDSSVFRFEVFVLFSGVCLG
jgi:hypothetical protein